MKSIYSRLQDSLIYVHLLLTFTHRTYVAGQSNSTCNDKETEYINIRTYICTYVHTYMPVCHVSIHTVHKCIHVLYIRTFVSWLRGESKRKTVRT